MPPINRPATVGVIAVSVAAAAAVAIYESPEIQRAVNDLRRRIAIALHSFGDRITPQERENLFNRPEDAEGFLRSGQRGQGDVPGVEADAETLRRQREELMYWNSLRECKEKGSEDEKLHRSRASTGSSNFDDFLKQDENAEKGAFVYQTGHELSNNEGTIRRRGNGSPRDSRYFTPSSNGHGIADDILFEAILNDGYDDEMSDIYSATDRGDYQPSRTMSPQQAATTPSVAQPETTSQQSKDQPAPASSESELGADEYMTAGQEDRDGAYSSIQAWAQGSSHDASFYSPLPVSPVTASEMDFVSDGQLTPADSASLAGSGVDVANEIASNRSFDVLSDASGMDTPASWTDIESVAGESEHGAMHS